MCDNVSAHGFLQNEVLQSSIVALKGQEEVGCHPRSVIKNLSYNLI